MSKILSYSLLLISILTNTASAAIKNEGEYSPEISPNGRHLVYHSHSAKHFFDIFIKDLTTNTSYNLTENAAYDVDASWSPDSQKLVFASNRSGQWDIYLFDVKSNKTKLLITDPAMDNHPIWSPDGSSIAYLSRRAGKSQIFLYDVKSKTQTKLTDTPHHIFHPSWANHGRSIIFDQSIDGKSSIYQLDLADGRIAKLYEGEGSSIAAERIQDKLVLTTKRESNWDIVEYNLSTKITRDLATSIVDEMKANVDLEKNRMAYSKTDSDGIPRVVIEKIH